MHVFHATNTMVTLRKRRPVAFYYVARDEQLPESRIGKSGTTSVFDKPGSRLVACPLRVRPAAALRSRCPSSSLSPPERQPTVEDNRPCGKS